MKNDAAFSGEPGRWRRNWPNPLSPHALSKLASSSRTGWRVLGHARINIDGALSGTPLQPEVVSPGFRNPSCSSDEERHYGEQAKGDDVCSSGDRISAGKIFGDCSTLK